MQKSNKISAAIDDVRICSNSCIHGVFIPIFSADWHIASTTMPTNKRGPRAPKLSKGALFLHPKHGQCQVLEQWQFDIDDAKGNVMKQQEVYFFRVSAGIDDAIVSSTAEDRSDVWDDTKGIFHDLSSLIRSYVVATKPIVVSSGWYFSFMERFKNFVCHPELGMQKLKEWPTSAVAESIKDKNPLAYKVALRLSKAVGKDFENPEKVNVYKAVARSLVNQTAILSDSMRKKLGNRRPTSSIAGKDVSFATTTSVTWMRTKHSTLKRCSQLVA